MLKNTRFIVELTISMALLFVSVMFLPATSFGSEQAEQVPDKGFSITLSVYSGRPNPHWWIVPSDPEYKRLTELIASLKKSNKAVFNYDEWNKLGYASFWIVPKGVEGLPSAIHVWRDMAYVQQKERGEAQYALGAAKIYDLLVSQSEKRDQGSFFVNYRKYQKENSL